AVMTAAKAIIRPRRPRSSRATRSSRRTTSHAATTRTADANTHPTPIAKPVKTIPLLPEAAPTPSIPCAARSESFAGPGVDSQWAVPRRPARENPVLLTRYDRSGSPLWSSQGRRTGHRENTVAAAAAVLVVDDDEATRAFVSEVLERAAIRTLQAASGHEALELAAAERPAAVVID